jgi:hypothetical protein
MVFKLSEIENEDMALDRLAPEELQKYINSLGYYIKNLDDREAMYLVIDNCIELSDKIPYIKSSYVEGQDKLLADILQLIEKIEPAISDKMLKALLQDNRKSILEFMDRLKIDYKKYYKYPKQDYDKTREYGKKLAREVLSMERGEVSRAIAEEINNVHGNVQPEPSIEVDQILNEGIKRFREKQNASLKLRQSLGQVHREQELNIDKDSRDYFNRYVLPKIAERIIKEEGSSK